MDVPDELRDGFRSLGQSLNDMDAAPWFERCIVGSASCNDAPISAHCVPRTALNLIADPRGKVIGIDSRAPINPVHWIATPPLGEHGVASFNVAKWACARHDRQFSKIDSTRIDLADDANLFALVYRTTAYLTQRALATGSRLAVPLLDPAVESPKGLPQDVQKNLERTATQLSIFAAQRFFVKSQLDKVWRNSASDEIEYRVASWSTTPTMAATGMKLSWDADYSSKPAGPHPIVAEWLVLLPQAHGQTLVTASLAHGYRYTGKIHEGMPANDTSILTKGNSWTRLQFRKVLAIGSDVAISHDRFGQATHAEQVALQRHFFDRTSVERQQRKLPNLLDVH